MHTVKEVDMLAARIDLLMIKIEEQGKGGVAYGIVQALSRTTSKVYGNMGHCWGPLSAIIMLSNFGNKGELTLMWLNNVVSHGLKEYVVLMEYMKK